MAEDAEAQGCGSRANSGGRALWNAQTQELCRSAPSATSALSGFDFDFVFLSVSASAVNIVYGHGIFTAELARRLASSFIGRGNSAHGGGTLEGRQAASYGRKASWCLCARRRA